ncbi:HAMP domain-containing sensor histidine kinase [Lactococcus cremoris]|uniref:sensor histidine kinase n=1 Tax=Lactococcus lactis subsp. cremoris TaxID=1359 RepID=UPI002870BFA6|nr:HAMP domain-containing sensor histidine kinase [Lactococcus cremoris]MDR9867362.1 HAMP domain-containing sensor histidine kinase [Lactococcus cremoris]
MTGMKNVSNLSTMNFQDLNGFQEQKDFIRIRSQENQTIMSKGTENFLENRTFSFWKITISNGKLYDTVYKKDKGITYEIWLSLQDIFEEVGAVLASVFAILLLNYLIGLLLIRHYSKKINGPIQKLAFEASQDSGLLEVPEAPVEVRELAINFNELVKSLQEKIESEKEFASNLSHELRTPVMAISGYISLLKRRREEHPEIVEKSLNYLEQESERLKKLIEDFLTLSRKGQIDYQEEIFTTKSLLLEIKSSFEIDSSNKIEIEGDDNLHIKTNRFALREILNILVENAIKYSPKGSMVLIKYDKKEIQVIDRGIGISDNENAKVFNRIYQVDKSRTNHTGNGIGLAIAQQYAQIINAEIYISDNLPSGTIFHLSFKKMSEK